MVQLWKNLPTVRNVEDSINSNLPTIQQAELIVGRGGAVLLITEQILEMIELINVGKQMTEKQAMFTAEMIIERFNDLRPTDLRIFAKRFVCGDYGKFYDKIDTMTIIEALVKFDKERQNEIVEMQIKENERLKRENDIVGAIPIEQLEKLKEVIKTFGKPKEKDKDFGNRPVIPPRIINNETK